MGNALTTFSTRTTRTLLHRLFIEGQIDDDDNDDMSNTAGTNTSEQGRDDAGAFGNPSTKDVLETKALLLKVSGLPLEIVDLIIDFAEYWPCISVKMDEGRTIYSGQEPHIMILRSLPLGYLEGCVPAIFANENDRKEYIKKSPVLLAPESIKKYEEIQSNTNKLLEQWTKATKHRGKYPCRKIVFTFQSRDQGWGGDPGCPGTYRGSYTWFDVGHERFVVLDGEQKASKGAAEDACEEMLLLRKTGIPVCDASKFQSEKGEEEEEEEEEEKTASSDMVYNLLTISPDVRPSRVRDPEDDLFPHEYLPDQNRLQANMTATSEAKEYVITWSVDDNIKPDSAASDELESQGRGGASMTGEFVKSLKIGDVVTIWAKARFGGWSNNVDSFKMDVYLAV